MVKRSNKKQLLLLLLLLCDYSVVVVEVVIESAIPGDKIYSIPSSFPNPRTCRDQWVPTISDNQVT